MPVIPNSRYAGDVSRLLLVLLLGMLPLPGAYSTVGATALGDSVYAAHHPRLLFTAAELPALQAKVRDGGPDDDAYTSIRLSADWAFPYATFEALLDNDGGTPYWGSVTMPMLGIASYLAVPPDNASLERGRDLTLYIADHYDPDLDVWGASLRLRSLALGYDMFFGNSPDSERTYVRDELVSYLHTLVYSWGLKLWYYRPYLQNRSAMMASAMGLAAIALDGEADPVLISDAIAAADAMTDSLLTYQFDPDGSYNEGALYAAWAMRHLVYYFYARKRWDGFDHGTDPRFRNLVNGLAYEILPGGHGTINNLNDCTYHDVPLSYHTSFLDWAQTEWSSPLAAWIWEHVAGTYGVDPGIVADKVGTVLWHQNLTPQQPDGVLPHSMVFRHRGLYQYRTGWQSGASSDDVMFTFYSGKYQGGHAQEDQNQFTLYAYGGRFAIDHGPGQKAKESEAHNIVFIDGLGEHNAGSSIGTDGEITEYLLDDFADYVLGDATRAYSTHSPLNDPGYPFPGTDWSWGYRGANPVQYARRAVYTIRESDVPPYFVIIDDIDKDGLPHTYEWRLHTLEGNDVDLSSDPVRITSGSSYLDIHTLAPDFASLSRSTAPFDNQSPEPNSTVISLSVTAVKPQFAFMLIPGNGTTESPHVKRKAYSWGTTVLVQWNNGVSDYLVFNPEGRMVTAPVEEAGGIHSDEDPRVDNMGAAPGAAPTIETDATFAVVRLRSAKMDRYLLSNGSRLSFGQITYAATDTRMSCALGRNAIHVDRVGTNFVFFAPSAKPVTCRGTPIPVAYVNGYITPLTLGAFEGTTVQTSVPAPLRVAAGPNPFNPTARLFVELQAPQHVRITIYDVQGRVVRRLWNGPLSEGRREFVWNAHGDRGNPVASGVYFARIEAGDQTETLKLQLLK